MTRLRVEQQKNEGADLFAIRAFAKAIPLMEERALIAAARWVQFRAEDELEARRKIPAAPLADKEGKP